MGDTSKDKHICNKREADLNKGKQHRETKRGVLKTRRQIYIERDRKSKREAKRDKERHIETKRDEDKNTIKKNKARHGETKDD